MRDEYQDVLARVAVKIRVLRQQRGLSQQRLSERSGLSRRMIVAIENEEANVSLSNLDRLAAALDVSLSELVRPPDAPDTRRIDAVAWRGVGPESYGAMLGTAPARSEAELWLWSLEEGERYPSEANSQNWHEMLLVLSGTLIIEGPGDEKIRNWPSVISRRSSGPSMISVPESTSSISCQFCEFASDG